MDNTFKDIKQLVALGKEHYEKGEYERAEKLFSQVLKENRGFADVFNMLGVIYHDQGRVHQAQECFEQALDLNPGYTEAALNLAVTYNDLGKYAEAKRVYSQAMAQSRKQPRSLDPYAKGKLANMHADLGDAYYGVGLFEEAIQEYIAALHLGPTFSDIRTKLANTYRDVGKKKEAVEQYREVIQSHPNYLVARLQLGVTLYSIGDVQDAIAQWEEVLKIDADNKSAKTYLRMAASESTIQA